MEFFNFKKNKKRRRYKQINYGRTSLKKIEKLINAELSSKISGSEIKYKELLLNTSANEIIEVIKF